VEKEVSPRGLGFAAVVDWGFIGDRGFGLGLTVARTARIAPQMVVRGWGYVACIHGFSDSRSGSQGGGLWPAVRHFGRQACEAGGLWCPRQGVTRAGARV
jgi:hypothetical protein